MIQGLPVLIFSILCTFCAIHFLTRKPIMRFILNDDDKKDFYELRWPLFYAIYGIVVISVFILSIELGILFMDII